MKNITTHRQFRHINMLIAIIITCPLHNVSVDRKRTKPSCFCLLYIRVDIYIYIYVAKILNQAINFIKVGNSVTAQTVLTLFHVQSQNNLNNIVLFFFIDPIRVIINKTQVFKKTQCVYVIDKKTFNKSSLKILTSRGFIHVRPLKFLLHINCYMHNIKTTPKYKFQLTRVSS